MDLGPSSGGVGTYQGRSSLCRRSGWCFDGIGIPVFAVVVRVAVFCDDP